MIVKTKISLWIGLLFAFFVAFFVATVVTAHISLADEEQTLQEPSVSARDDSENADLPVKNEQLPTVQAAVSIDNVRITEARIRAMPPGTSNTAAYLTIKNLGKSDIRLEKVEAPVSGHIMIHDTVKKDDKMSMVHQKSVTIPAGKKIKFVPGGMHIMIMDLKKHLMVGESVPLTLHFSNGRIVTTNAMVKKQVSEQGNLSG